MNEKKNYIKNIISLLTLLFISVSCVDKSNYNIYSFFFDGVPNPIKDTTKNTLIENKKIENKKVVEEVLEYIHKPYANKDCLQCHTVGQKAILKLDVPDLCYNCHTKFDTVYTELHGPVAGGMCGSCHQPHNSKFKKLLITENNSDLCYNCHSEDDVKKNTVHNNQTVCMKCHNPHGGKTNKFLR